MKRAPKTMRPLPTQSPPRIVAELSSRALLLNYKCLQNQAPKLRLIPMVKANGYGHGSHWVAMNLLDQKSLEAFGVATLEEGKTLRESLGSKSRARIIVFSGATPWRDMTGPWCDKYHLTPVITRWEDLVVFLRDQWEQRLDYEIKFNTGMNRLGIPMPLLSRVASRLRTLSNDKLPRGILSHLAVSEEAQHLLSRGQRDAFDQVRKELSFLNGRALFHLGNSVALWNAKAWRLNETTDAARPGLSLYGIPPWSGADAKNLTPVMTIRAEVIARRILFPGESTGYGALYKQPRSGATKTQEMAILAAGYADGVHRMLSNQGHVWLDGKRERFLGRVSMDLSAVSCKKSTQTGAWAELYGPHLDPWEQAKLAGTVPYEILTSASDRVIRTERYGK